MASWKQGAQVFRTMPWRSLMTFLSGVALLFAAFGAVQDAMGVEQGHEPRLVFSMVMSGVSAATWALFGSMRMVKSLIALAAVQITLVFLSAKFWPPKPQALALDQLQRELLKHDGIVLGFILVGYLLLIHFFGMEGNRFFAAHTEIRLASEIQKQLVPPISKKAGAFEFYGISVPSGTVGGDLLDVVTAGDFFCAYLADVAGHGVPAGVLMSMVKSAVRMRIASVGSYDDELLPALNEVLQPLTSPSVYATFAYIAGGGDSRLRFSLAGHLPIFHFKFAKHHAELCRVENLPLGMFADASYQTATVECRPGDILAMITDGLTEVFDQEGRELGWKHVENTLADCAGEPLPEIAARIIRTSEAFGPITDDRTLLLMHNLGKA